MLHIFTDSTSDFTREEGKKRGINLLSLSVRFGEEEFVDGVTMTPVEFYEKLSSSNILPVTSQINPDAFIDAFKPYKDTQDEIIYIAIGSKFSGTYQSAIIAKDELAMDNLYIVDSEQVTVGIAILVQLALDLKAQGKTGSEIYETLLEMKNRVVVYAALDTLTYLHKGGRLSAGKAIVGSVLGVKPILKVKNNVIIPFDTKRGFNNALKAVAENVATTSPDKSLPVMFGHSNATEHLKSFKELLSKDILDKEALTAMMGPVIGTHAGPNAVAIAIFEN